MDESTTGTRVVYLYRWRLKPGKEEQFISAWAYVTAQLRDRSGSLGSRLHHGDDGLWYGYAQWPSVEHRGNAHLNHDEIVEARRLMKDATTEALPAVALQPIRDLLVP